MAYISGQQIVKDLPLDVEESPVTPSEAQEIVEKWVGFIADAGATSESPTARDIVEVGASAEVLKKAMRRSGYVETAEADEDLKDARRRLERFDKLVVGTGEGGEAEPDELPGVTVVVSEFYEDPA